VHGRGRVVLERPRQRQPQIADLRRSRANHGSILGQFGLSQRYSPSVTMYRACRSRMTGSSPLAASRSRANSRMVSSMVNRGSSPTPSTAARGWLPPVHSPREHVRRVLSDRRPRSPA
jgi:hypothetical protein